VAVGCGYRLWAMVGVNFKLNKFQKNALQVGKKGVEFKTVKK
jgi:hypothetical protein